MKNSTKSSPATVGPTARDIMSTDVVTVVPSMSLRAAAAVLRDNRITGAAVVTETGRLIGVLSETDLVERDSQPRIRKFTIKRPARGARLGSTPAKTFEMLEAIEQPSQDASVGEVFSPYVITARPDSSLARLAAEMVWHQVHRIFILDGTELRGVVSSMDVMKAVSLSHPTTRKKSPRSALQRSPA